MNKLLVALIAGALASMAAAQTADPKMTTKEKQEAVRSTTGATANAKDMNTKMVNSNNSGGVGATAAMQRETTAASKETPKQRPNMNTPEAQKAMQKVATQ